MLSAMREMLKFVIMSLIRIGTGEMRSQNRDQVDKRGKMRR
jgi:hypothetical protein